MVLADLAVTPDMVCFCKRQNNTVLSITKQFFCSLLFIKILLGNITCLTTISHDMIVCQHLLWYVLISVVWCFYLMEGYCWKVIGNSFRIFLFSFSMVSLYFPSSVLSSSSFLSVVMKRQDKQKISGHEHPIPQTCLHDLLKSQQSVIGTAVVCCLQAVTKAHLHTDMANTAT